MRTHIRSYSAIIVLLLTAVMFVSLFSVPARAAGPWYVAPTGSDANSCLSPGSPCATIIGAINKASSGDTIYVATGLYIISTNSEVVLIDRNIYLSGGWDLTFTTQGSNSTIDGNGAYSGIVINSGVTATVDRFAVHNGFGYGGGIWNVGTLTLNNSTISGNTTIFLAKAGGVFNEGTLTVNSSIISGNTAYSESSGGIYNVGTMTLYNSTISENIGGNGGGIRNDGNMILYNSTVSGNTSQVGGGIYTQGSVTLQNTILAGNASLGTGLDCYGSITSAGYNLIGNTTGCTISGNATGNITGRDPLLGTLQDNGGPTLTQALLQDSPAVNAGNPAGCTDQQGNLLTADQRGKSRVGRCDMGAYELQPLGFSTKLADRQISHHGEAISYTITLDNPGAAEITGVQLSDALPAHLGFVNGSLSASKGQAAYQNGVISWTGTLSAQEQVQVVFAATIDDLAPLNQPITNTAEIQGGGEVFVRKAAVLVESYQISLPVILRPCLPLYSDNFSNPASGWLVADDGDNRYEYLNGEYRILVRPTQWGAGVDPGFQSSDYSVAVNLRNPNAANGSYGIAFGVAGDWSTFYTLEIYPNGWYGIYRYDPTAIVTLSEAYSPAIHQGSAANQIKVERIGSTINAYANGQLLASVADGTYAGSLYIGLVVFSYNQPNVDIRFDNFTVYSSSCPGPAAALSVTDGVSELPAQRFLNIQRVEKSHSKLQR